MGVAPLRIKLNGTSEGFSEGGDREEGEGERQEGRGREVGEEGAGGQREGVTKRREGLINLAQPFNSPV